MIKLTNFNFDTFATDIKVQKKDGFPFLQYVITKNITKKFYVKFSENKNIKLII